MTEHNLFKHNPEFYDEESLYIDCCGQHSIRNEEGVALCDKKEDCKYHGKIEKRIGLYICKFYEE